jgi:hypothetical protein
MTRTEDRALSPRMLKAGALGGIDSYAAYPVGWGNASNTPFRYFKRTQLHRQPPQWPSTLCRRAARSAHRAQPERHAPCRYCRPHPADSRQ